MNRTMDQALAGAHRGDAALLATFGIERQTVAGMVIPGAGPEWEERLTLTGAGTAAMLRRRSAFDLIVNVCQIKTDYAKAKQLDATDEEDQYDQSGYTTWCEIGANNAQRQLHHSREN